jgi:hypothetical protein
MGAPEHIRLVTKKEQTPPSDPMRDVFTYQVLSSWRGSQAPSPELAFRLQVVEAHGPYPCDPQKADSLRSLRALKAAWETYLCAAFASSMFVGEKGKDLLGRLRGMDDDGFRSAMAECMVCWFFAGRMRLPVTPNAEGRGSRNLEFRIITGDGGIGVEVKAPFREAPMPLPGKSTACWVGDDADKITQCLEAANRQFDKNGPNLLAITPRLRMRVFSQRRDLVKAIYGDSKIVVPINIQTGEPGPTGVEFFPDGKFLNTTRPGGKPMKADGLPGYRRISAVVTIEEKIVEAHPYPSPFALLAREHLDEIWPIWKRENRLHYSSDNRKWVEHDVLVLHNPFAYHPVSSVMWEDIPQFVEVDGEMKWTDKHGTEA